ncbi:MAG TPA: TlpA disulfide reductase family protein [Pyrinomonadaceae bacterium]|nr:TlpA disulfide reductase family protein [Pyrinomonadaceae bacterium]
MNLKVIFLFAIFSFIMVAGIASLSVFSQSQDTAWTKQETPIRNQIRGLRDLPDDVRAGTTKQLALDIRALPKSAHKLALAYALANLSTEGDFGRDTLQDVATTLAEALREQPVPMNGKDPAGEYVELATLARYEHVNVSSDNPQYVAALARLEKDDEARQQGDFTLTDLQGKSWTLKSLQGKVVLVNFWATWCPPCRKEMPDLDVLYQRFQEKGFVILAISDEGPDKVKPFLAERKVTYPILLDPGRKVNDLFRINGIPKSFVYDRNGKLVAQSIDMRTQKQFLDMLGQAGLH